MEYNLDKGCHSVYSLQFHLIFCVKYRKKVLTGRVSERLKELTTEIANHFGITIIEQETDSDHIHILFSSKPAIKISSFVNSLKAVTSRKLKIEFPELSKHLWTNKFWSPSYFISTTGQVKLADLKRYVENQQLK
ncbi:MAG: IS200/IS605 family transposase [Deltaproteobacteria bacterium]|nr:IS200/IS605 family transposase [Deltaproteobacteria bacterium]MBF0526561.1 IS200/IS605 family transposase [Deltaproteobacteria bacterium]